MSSVTPTENAVSLQLIGPAIGENLAYLRWAMAHLKDGSALVTQIEVIFSSDPNTTTDQRIAAFQSAIDLVKIIWSDFPGQVTTGTAKGFCKICHGPVSQEDLNQLAREGVLTQDIFSANGALILVLLQNMDKIIALIQAIFAIIHGNTPGIVVSPVKE